MALNDPLKRHACLHDGSQHVDELKLEKLGTRISAAEAQALLPIFVGHVPQEAARARRHLDLGHKNIHESLPLMWVAGTELGRSFRLAIARVSKKLLNFAKTRW